MATIVPSKDAKELRKELVSKKQERLNLIFKMGESVHKQSLHNTLEHEEINKISQDILQNDKEIYQLTQEVMKLTNSQGKCTNCQQSILKEVKFCGNCGTLNPLFEDQHATKVTCFSCEEAIPADLKFCPCCGVKQGAL